MTAHRFRIIVPLDLSEYSEIVLEHALDQAARHDNPDLHIVHVIPADVADVEPIKQRLAALVVGAVEGVDCTNWHVRLHVRAGKPPEEIAALAAEIRAHLIVLGNFGVARRRRGSIASQLVDLAPCPTLVVGLTDHAVEVDAQCPDCVEVRAASDGERWFCAAHSAPDRMRLSTLVPTGASMSGAGLLW